MDAKLETYSHFVVSKGFVRHKHFKMIYKTEQCFGVVMTQFSSSK